jgi:hypothetical protein
MNKNKLTLGLGALLLLCNMSAYADYYNNGPRGYMVTCTTSSNGLNFQEQSLDHMLAQTQAINSCTQDSRTANDECNANVACSDDAYQRPMISCETSSNGLRFNEQSRDRNVAINQIIRQCTSDSRTSNDECNANVACNDTMANPMVSCSTISNGLTFTDQSRDRNVAINQIIRQCTQDSRTSNDECSANISCDDSMPAPMITCSTSSRGLRFSDQSRDRNVAMNQTINQCTRDSRTSNAECSANLYCDSGDQYPNPLPPTNPYPNPYPPTNPYPNPYPVPGPGPGPRPQPPVELCTISRFDPAGMFIQSYRGRGCDEARRMCEMELRGRQTCR